MLVYMWRMPEIKNMAHIFPSRLATTVKRMFVGLYIYILKYCADV